MVTYIVCPQCHSALTKFTTYENIWQHEIKQQLTLYNLQVHVLITHLNEFQFNDCVQFYTQYQVYFLKLHDYIDFYYTNFV